jgi:integral membrane protein
VENVASFLTKNMGIFFVPAGVGLITQLDLIRNYWIAIVLSMVLSTVLVLAVVAWSEQAMEQRAEKRKRRKEGSL